MDKLAPTLYCLEDGSFWQRFIIHMTVDAKKELLRVKELALSCSEVLRMFPRLIFESGQTAGKQIDCDNLISVLTSLK